MSITESSVVVVGAGISGVACAREVAAAGRPVVVLDRGRAVGGRMARWTRDGRAVDIGAAYFTVRSSDFSAVAESWATRGLAHPWADTFSVAGSADSTTNVGPVRWAAEQGLRSLVADLADGLDVRLESEVAAIGVEQAASDATTSLRPSVDGQPVAGVVLAMPDPQAADLLGDDLAEARDVLDSEWNSVLTVVAYFPRRTWHAFDGMFVHDSPVSLVVDDGRRRGDGAPVLVVHSTHDAAREHLDDPAGFVEPALAEVRRLIGDIGEPAWCEAKRWGSAEPRRTRSQTFWLGRGTVALCGDGWSARPRIEAAWTSGRDAGRALLERLR